MELPPFTLIYRNSPEPDETTRRRTPGDESVVGEAINLPEQLLDIHKLSPESAKLFASLNPNLSRTLMYSVSLRQQPSETDTSGAVAQLQHVLKDLERDKKVETVAAWDMDASVAEITPVVKLLNEAQTVFTFFNLHAPKPAGLVIQPAAFEEWRRSRGGQGKQAPTKQHIQKFDDNIMSNDFYKHARVVHKTIGVDYLLAVTRQMIAGKERGVLFWNHFATSSERILLISTYDLREYARSAGRPFEAAVAMLAVSQLLVETNKRLRYHKDTGCIFDLNKERDAIINSLRECKIDDQCRERLDDRYRVAAIAMVEALKAYRTEANEEARAPQVKGQDDAYWLRQLSKLSKPAKPSKG